MQNKILLDRLEALHIKMTENDRNAVGTSGAVGVDPQSDGSLQTVISYLRRSKEIVGNLPPPSLPLSLSL